MWDPVGVAASVPLPRPWLAYRPDTPDRAIARRFDVELLGREGWARLVELVTIAPARLLGLDARGIGRLEEGLPADIAVIDPAAEWTIDPASFLSKSRNTPFAGRRVRGRVTDAIVGGRHVLADGCIAAPTRSALAWC